MSLQTTITHIGHTVTVRHRVRRASQGRESAGGVRTAKRWRLRVPHLQSRLPRAVLRHSVPHGTRNFRGVERLMGLFTLSDDRSRPSIMSNGGQFQLFGSGGPDGTTVNDITNPEKRPARSSAQALAEADRMKTFFLATTRATGARRSTSSGFFGTPRKSTPPRREK